MLSLERKLELWKLCGYEPHNEQLEAHACDARVLLVAGGERAGKSRWTSAEMTAELVPDPSQIIEGELKPKRVAVAADSYDEGHKEMLYTRDDLDALGLLKSFSHPKQGKWTIETNAGGWVETVSMKEGGQELTGRGEPYDLVCIVEAGRVKEKCFKDARLRVAETRGRVILSGTIWSEFGWYPELWEELKGPNVLEGRSFSIPTWANTAVFPGGRNDPEILAVELTLSKEEFARRLGAQVVPSPARIYPQFDAAIHMVEQAPFDRDVPVDLTIDSGYFPSKYAVLAVQPRLSDLADHDPSETAEQRLARADMRPVLFVLDEIWEQNLVHQQIIEMCRERFWWPNVQRIWIGHEGVQHAAQRSTEEVWVQETGLPVTICARLDRKYHGFMRVQTFLKDPLTEKARLFLDKRCEGLKHEMQRYERKTNRFHRVISDDPPADAEDDALDALTNYLIDQYGLAERKRAPVYGRRGRRSRPARG